MTEDIDAIRRRIVRDLDVAEEMIDRTRATRWIWHWKAVKAALFNDYHRLARRRLAPRVRA